ncbi:MAG: transcriptional regulator [Acidobacteria bacterium]|nr:transcriptional regulator [Acidobacteriota bacterium]
MAVLTALSACDSADYVFLQRLTGLQSGNLSQHLARLEEAKFVSIAKGFSGKYPQTTVSLTTAGRKAIQDYWARLESLKKAQRTWSRKGATATLKTRTSEG